MAKQIRLLVVSLALAGSAFGAQRVQTDEHQPMPPLVRISTKDANRIALAPGLRVASAWCSGDKCALDKEESTGEVIVMAVTKEPFTLFISDDAGATHVLQAVPMDIPGETVLVEPLLPPLAAEAAEREVPYMARVTVAIRDIRASRLPAGFSIEQSNRPVPLWQECSFTRVRSFRSSSLQLDEYRLVNTGSSEMRLDERELRRYLGSTVAAVSLRRDLLQPHEETQVLVVRRALR